MKRNVITYWIAPEEEYEFIQFLQSTGPIIAFAAEWKETKVAVAPQKLEDFLQAINPSQLMIAQENAYVIVETHGFSGRVRYNITAEQSAVITYRRGRLVGDKLGQSNLAFYSAVSERPKKADELLQLWGKKVFRWVRDRTPHLDETGKYRLTSNAKRGVDMGTWKLSF